MRTLILPLLLLVVSCTSQPSDTVPVDANPVASEWTGPYGGVPAFDQVDVAHFRPALTAGMDEKLRDIDAITASNEPPTFDNTVAAYERSGKTLQRARTLYGIWSSSMSSDAFQEVEREMAPVLAAFQDQIYQNTALFERIAAVYNSDEYASLPAEDQRLTWLYYTDFVRSGASLDAESKARLSEINQSLASLFTAFSQNVLADEAGQTVHLTAEDQLAGLSDSQREAAAAAAEAAGMDGWLITNTRSSAEPFLTYADRRDMRETVWQMWVNRGDNPGDHDNNPIMTEILALRAERAGLLGYETHAHWRLERAMAGTPDRAVELMDRVWEPAKTAVRDEVASMMEFAAEDGLDTIEPWDYRFYAEKVRAARYDLDNNAVKPYLQLDKLRDGMFWVAGDLFGFEFTPIDDVPVFHPDMAVWKVTDRDSGEHIGLWYFDPYARAGKNSGAWMNAYRRQSRFDGDVATIVSNNSNFVKGRPGEPVLISWTDAVTLFHEFGHALHGLASNVNYPSLSGTAVPRDYVEFPSQLLEHWLSTPEVLNRFALHFETGEPIPAELVERIERASTFRQGFDTVEFLGSAIVDMKAHTSKAESIDMDAFERETLAEIGMPDEIVMRHRSPHFSHIFSGDSYSAGYYSYLWADVLTADAYGAFTEAGGPYDRTVVDRLVEHIFSKGNTVDPAQAYRDFRGRDPEVDALMRKRGLSE